jgi:hypothetical protein
MVGWFVVWYNGLCTNIRATVELPSPGRCVVSLVDTRIHLAQRPLKHHEAKLLKKVDFLSWKKERNMREIKILRRYLIQNPEDYTK